MTNEELQIIESTIVLPHNFVGNWLGRKIYFNPIMNIGVALYTYPYFFIDQLGSFEYIKDWIEFGAISMNKNPYSILKKLNELYQTAGQS